MDTESRAPGQGRRRSRRWWLLLLLLPLLAAGGFVLWAAPAMGPQAEALAALQSDGQVTVTTEPWLAFAPASGEPATGLIFYPGAKVDPRAYAPAAHQLAAQGYLVVIPSMPLNLAVLAPDRAADVIAAYPQVDHWVVGGHSLGGAMAAQFARGHPDLVDGLVLWAAYPADNASLATRQDLPVTLISGTHDGLATPDKIEHAHELLPPDTRYVPIDGGNHAQFGWYGAQDGDGAATISREAQQTQIISATVQLLQSLK